MTTQMQDASQSLTSAAPLRAARWWAGGCLLIAAAVHVPVIAPHLSEAPYIGVLFILLTAACVILTPALVAYDSRILWVIAGVVTLLAVVAYVLARTIGLPQIGDDIGNWSDPLGTAAVASESLTFVTAGVVLVSRRRTGGVPVITGGVPVIEPVEIPDR
jgi:hypothetical protein